MGGKPPPSILPAALPRLLVPRNKVTLHRPQHAWFQLHKFSRAYVSFNSEHGNRPMCRRIAQALYFFASPIVTADTESIHFSNSSLVSPARFSACQAMKN